MKTKTLLLYLAATIAAGSSSIASGATVPAPHFGEGGVPQFERDVSWPKAPAAWTQGASVSDVKADQQGNIWMITRPDEVPENVRGTAPPPVLEFDSSGKLLRGWGGQNGPGYLWPNHGHEIELDSKGDVWVVGAGMKGRKDEHGNLLPPDSQILKFTPDGKFLMAIGKPGMDGSNTSDVLKGPAGLFYYAKTNEMFVADGYGNSRVAVFDAATGRLKRSWGAYGAKPLDPADRKTTPLGEGARGAPDVWGPVAARLQQFDTVHDVAVSDDGLVYVADRGNRRVQVFTIDGKFLAEQFVGLDLNYDLQARGLAFSPDQRFLYVGGTPGVFILNRRTLEILGALKATVANEHPVGHHIGVDAKGNLYLTYTGIFDAPNGSKTFGVERFVFNGYSPAVKCCEAVRHLTVKDGMPSPKPPAH